MQEALWVALPHLNFIQLDLPMNNIDDDYSLHYVISFYTTVNTSKETLKLSYCDNNYDHVDCLDNWSVDWQHYCHLKLDILKNTVHKLNLHFTRVNETTLRLTCKDTNSDFKNSMWETMTEYDISMPTNGFLNVRLQSENIHSVRLTNIKSYATRDSIVDNSADQSIHWADSSRIDDDCLNWRICDSETKTCMYCWPGCD